MEQNKQNNIAKRFINKNNVFAVVGVSRDKSKYGRKVFDDLKKFGYEVYPINSKVDHISKYPCYADIKDLPVKPDVISFVVPPEIVEKLIIECKKLNINKVCLFTPYSKKLKDEVLEYFKSEEFEITSNAYFDIEADYDIGKVDQNYLYDVLSKIDLNGAEALFVSCTALPILPIIDKLEKKLNTTVLSSNQVLIWDTLVKIDKNNSVEGFGKLFQSN
mgnify:CR=1 FL=1